MPETTTTTKNNPAAAPIALCDEPGCTEPATFAYAWEWGKSGNVCSKHQAHYVGLEKNLKRRCTFTPLASVVAPALTRPERTQLIAERLSAEAEVVEVKSRGVELYNQNIELTRQVQSMKVRSEEREAQLRDAQGRELELNEKLVTLEATHAELVQEVQRLRALVPKEPKAKNVVGGAEKEK